MPTYRSVLVHLGETVRGLRKRAGWTRRQLAQRTGISERFLADVETGKANPSVVKLCVLASALGTDAASLIAGRREPRSFPTIALLGLRGAGKSSVGRALADRLGRPLVELDAEVESAAGLPLAQIFELNGEAAFRRAEREALRELLASDRRTCVLATGGGLVTDWQTFELLRGSAHTVWLRARPEDHWDRVVAQGDTRPMAGGRDEAFLALGDILAERERLYRLAELAVDTSGRTVDELGDELETRFRPLTGVDAGPG